MSYGYIFCHDCSSRSIALPQMGYTKAVRVCNDCFEVAYLVAYCLSDELGTSTQIHGARGIYDLIETNDVKVIQSVLDHGGLDAMIYLCGFVHGYDIHALATNSIAALSEHPTIQGIIVSKKAMPTLFHLAMVYTQNPASPPRPPSPPMSLVRMSSNLSIHTKNTKRVETITAILINITHIVYQMIPNRVRTRAMEKAILAMAKELGPGDGQVSTEWTTQQPNDSDSASDGNEGLGRLNAASSAAAAGVAAAADDFEPGLIVMDELYHMRLESMQAVAAKCISVMAAEIPNQAFIVDDPERIDRLVQLLYSNNPDVVKYASKTMAYLSLRNDKHKPDIVKGTTGGAGALLSVLRMATAGVTSSSRGEENCFSHFEPGQSDSQSSPFASQTYSEAVSHACCALANLATNTESQEILMSQLDLINTTCAVVNLFPHQREIERHVARLIANLALYEQNKLSLLTAYTTKTDGLNEVSPHPVHRTPPHRYSSPPPPARRAKGNVIPTLLAIGRLTLEWAGNPEEHEEGVRSYSSYLAGQDAIDFMNDDGQQHQTFSSSTNSNKNNSIINNKDPGYLTPNDSSSENDISQDNEDHLHHHRHADQEAEEQQQEEGQTTKTPLEETPLEWVTIRGMEDVQRHIIRAIDNLMTLVMEDPTSHQSFKVVQRIWPTLGLIKAIQLANQDEDTQRRATHVLTTLIQQQQFHAETIKATAVQVQEQQQLKQQHEQHQQKREYAIQEEQEMNTKQDQEMLQKKHQEEKEEIERIEVQERLDREEQQRIAAQTAAAKEEAEQAAKTIQAEAEAKAAKAEAKAAKARTEAEAKIKAQEEDAMLKAQADKEEAEAEAEAAKQEAAAAAAAAIKEAEVKELARAEKERQIRAAVELKKAERDREKRQEAAAAAARAAEEEAEEEEEKERVAKEQRKIKKRLEKERVEKERVEQLRVEQEEEQERDQERGSSSEDQAQTSLDDGFDEEPKLVEKTNKKKKKGRK
ncbi:hypothetical protein BG004_005987 [Podila humilis]|nr:hypothetical protein BG004_005987 [Podila humilis]